MSAYARVQDALERAGSTKRGNDWTCPAHKGGTESNPSLSVTEGEKGVVLHCHTGCTVEEVIAAINLTTKDLFNQPLKTRAQLREIAKYNYENNDGKLLFQVIRYVDEDTGEKTFRQRHQLGPKCDAECNRKSKDGKWVWNLHGVQRALYRTPELATDQTIYVVEGEKDVEAIRDIGGVATTAPGGAEKWQDDYADRLKGASEVVVIADKDNVGRKHAAKIIASLVKRDVKCRLMEAKEGHDAHDHITKGWGLDDFQPITDAVAVEPDEVLETAAVNPMWAKLLDTNDIDNIPPPSYIVDKYLVANSLCVVYGKPAAGKSFLTIDWALCIANGIDWLGQKVLGGDVLYVIAEGLSGIGPRKKAWQHDRGCPSPSGLKWYPEPVNLLDRGAVENLTEVVDTLQPIAVFIDTLARSIPGADENSPAPMSHAIETVDGLRRATHAGIVLNAHTPKEGTTIRGHSSLEGAIQTGILVQNSEGNISVSVEKQKDDEPVSRRLQLRRVLDSAVLYPTVDTDSMLEVTVNDMQLLQVIRESAGGEGLSNSALLRMSGIEERTFHRSKKRLELSGKIVNVGGSRQPRWAVPNLDGE